MSYCIANGINYSPVTYLENFDALSHDFWKYYDKFESNYLDDLTENLRISLHIQETWMTYRMRGRPYMICNNDTCLSIEFDEDIITSVIVTDSKTNILFSRKISMISFKEYVLLSEMARIMGSPFSTLEFGGNKFRTQKFESSKDWKTVKELTPEIRLQFDGNNIYHVNDHSNKETIYLSKIEQKESTPGFQQPHIEQSIVDRVKNTEKLPKGFATSFVYDHFNQQPLPLKSSSTQYNTGAAMWDRLIDRALSDDKFVYATSPNAIERITADHRKQFLTNATRSDQRNQGYEDKHIVISHQPLQEFGEI